jgi:hypothetical protein
VAETGGKRKGNPSIHPFEIRDRSIGGCRSSSQQMRYSQGGEGH